MSVRGRRLAPWGVAALACALTACGSSSKSESNGAPPSRAATSVTPGAAGSSATVPATTSASGPGDACRLITPAEAQTALGKPVKAAKARTLGSGANCTYESTDFANGTAAGLALTITFFPRSSMSKAQFDKTYGSNGSRAVPGLGDGSWYLGGMLNIYDHGANLSIAIVSLRAEATVDQLTPVARLAIQRI
jgi:hypothetical protein